MSNEVIFDTREWVWGGYLYSRTQTDWWKPSSDEVSLSHMIE